MQFPWVRRDRFRAAQALGDTAYQSALDCWKRAENRYDALLEKYHALKLAGGAAVDAVVVPEPITPPEILMRAIRTVSPTQDAAYRMNYRWAMDQQPRWTDETYMRECAELIRRGSAPPDDTQSDEDSE